MSFTSGQALGASDLNDFDTDDITVDTTTLVTDSSTNRVGIGTATPDAQLHVEGTRPEIRLTETDAAGGEEYEIVATGDDFIIRTSDDAWASDVDRLKITAHDGDLDLMDGNGATALRVKSTGEVRGRERVPRRRRHGRQLCVREQR